MLRKRLINGIHKYLSDEEYEYESDTEEDIKRGCTCCHHHNNKVRQHNKDLHEKRFNNRVEFLKNASYDEIVDNCVMFPTFKILKDTDNKYYTIIDDNKIYLDKFDINEKTIIYYDDTFYNILSMCKCGNKHYIDHTSIYDFEDSMIMSISHDIKNIINKYEDFNINEHDIELYVDKLYTDILIIIDKNTKEKLLMTNIRNLSNNRSYAYEEFDCNKYFYDKVYSAKH